MTIPQNRGLCIDPHGLGGLKVIRANDRLVTVAEPNRAGYINAGDMFGPYTWPNFFHG